MSPKSRDMTLDVDQVGLNQITSLGSIHCPRINRNWNSLEK